MRAQPWIQGAKALPFTVIYCVIWGELTALSLGFLIYKDNNTLCTLQGYYRYVQVTNTEMIFFMAKLHICAVTSRHTWPF